MQTCVTAFVDNSKCRLKGINKKSRSKKLGRLRCDVTHISLTKCFLRATPFLTCKIGHYSRHGTFVLWKETKRKKGVNFTYVLREAFTLLDPKSVNKIDNLTVFFTL